jgi:hypothetical protein
MTVEELIWALEDLDNPNAEIKIAYQPQYPMGMNVNDMLATSKDGKEVYISQISYGGNFYLSEEIIEQLEW